MAENQELPQPKPELRAQVRIIFIIDGNRIDATDSFFKVDFKAMVNGGYILKAELYDWNFAINSELVKRGYFKKSRTEPLLVEFQLLHGAESQPPEQATKVQYAYVISLKASGSSGDRGMIEFVAMDPPSWLLNCGDAFGGCFKGRVDEVMRQVISRYGVAAGSGIIRRINANISKTTDSPNNKWWMMRQDPKTFISSLLDWSSSVTEGRTHWLVESDGDQFNILEQSKSVSRQRAYYRYYSGESTNIRNWEFLSDNALSSVQTKLLAQGASALSGIYLDRTTDKSEEIVYVKDATTKNKQIASVDDWQSTSKPPDGKPPKAGWTSISCIPEIGSAGEIGKKYSEYIDGRPRGMWLNMINSLLRTRITIPGHGIWSDCVGLGVDTIFLRWVQIKTDGEQEWWMTGNWIVYGFHHKVTRGGWSTELYCARYDYDATAKKVGSSNPKYD